MPGGNWYWECVRVCVYASPGVLFLCVFSQFIWRRNGNFCFLYAYSFFMRQCLLGWHRNVRTTSFWDSLSPFPPLFFQPSRKYLKRRARLKSTMDYGGTSVMCGWTAIVVQFFFFLFICNLLSLLWRALSSLKHAQGGLICAMLKCTGCLKLWPHCLSAFFYCFCGSMLALKRRVSKK